MTTATSPHLAGPGTDLCRITVIGPAGRVDLAIPASTTMAQLLPVLLTHVVTESERAQPWVLQRLGAEPLAADGTAESLDLREGEILYLRPAPQAMPVLEFDDAAVGVADSLEARGDRVRPAVIRRLLLGVGSLMLAVFAAGCFTVRPNWLMAPALGVAAVVLLASAILLSRSIADTAAGVIGGLWGCGFAALAGLGAVHGAAAILSPGRRDVLLAGACAALAAAIVLAAARVPIAPFGAALGIGMCAMIGAWLAIAFHWDPARTAGLIAVVLFIAGTRSVRAVLRLAQIRVPLLPRTAAELQEDINPDPAQQLGWRTATAVSYLDSFTVASAAVFITTFVLLTRSSGWPGWVLSLLLAGSVLLRAREMGGVWQCTALSVAGTAGIALVLISGTGRNGPLTAAVLLAALLVIGALLLVAAGRIPGRRQTPVWGHLADQLEGLTAFALVPVLLQLMHTYAYFRSLIG
jgi:type VII secretion integral membrane protein EccD